MDAHEAFREWAVSRGVEISKITSYQFKGRGIGIVAQETIMPDEVILFVPVRALFTVGTIQPQLAKKMKGMTVHGMLAAELFLDSSTQKAAWRAILPDVDELLESIPLTWAASLQALLPQEAMALLQNQQVKLDTDFSISLKKFPTIERRLFTYYWLIVNTRTFYYLLPRSNRSREDPNEHMAVNPFADYFNHADMGCTVNRGPKGFTITSDRKYEKGDEICISYGHHSNDFLLAEYGFLLAKNKWDEIQLDCAILPHLTATQKESLSQEGFLGKYVLDTEGACHRTQVAMRLLCVNQRKWIRFVSGQDEGLGDQAAVDRKLHSVLGVYLLEAETKLQTVRSNIDGHKSQRDKLELRWKQVIDLLRPNMERLENKNNVSGY